MALHCEHCGSTDLQAMLGREVICTTCGQKSYSEFPTDQNPPEMAPEPAPKKRKAS